MDFRTEYEKRLTSAEDIASRIRDGWRCCTDIAASIPPAIMEALGKCGAKGEIRDVRLDTMLDLQPYESLSREAARGIKPVSWFSGGGLRTAVNEGRADIMPCIYSEMPSLFDRYGEIDALFLTVAPMDRHGYFSAGATGSNLEVLFRKAKRIYLEVNRKMPRVLSAPQIHVTKVEALCENDAELPVSPPPDIDEVSKTIGSLIAEMIPNGATLQFGIGAVPDAVGLMLRDKRDLGIHTELFTDSMAELIECGAVTNEFKPIYRGKSVATLAFGSKRIYDYIDDNPAFLMLPVSQVNDPAVIAAHPNFISVNAALEVDFFGQVCAESMGTRHVSGSGGQIDYVRGATHSKNGKSFIAFPSTAKNGTVSRIRATLSEGAVVTTGKNDVDYIVTEYGIAKLKGYTLSERVRSLIAIAHPDFREELIWQAKKRNIII